MVNVEIVERTIAREYELMALRYFLKRLALALPVLWAVSTIVFLLIHLIPGDPVDVILGENAIGADRAALAELAPRRARGRAVRALSRGARARRPGAFDLRPAPRDRAPDAARGGHGAAGLPPCSSRWGWRSRWASSPRCAAGGSCDQLAMLAGADRDLDAELLARAGADPDLRREARLAPDLRARADASLVLPAITLGAGLAAMLSRLTRASMLDELGATTSPPRAPRG